MSVRNRNASTGRRRSGGVSVLRDMLVMGLLALLSFALGFFVLARLMPDSHPAPPSDNAVTPASRTDSDKKADTHSDTTQESPPAAPKPALRKKAAPKDDGPTLEADNAAPEKPVRKTALKDAPPAPDDTAKRVQTPQQPGDAPITETPQDAPEKPKRYRVQIGVYATREKAEEIAQGLLDRGISVKAQPAGRLFRVQCVRLFKTRPAAEAMLQKLSEAGSDGTIVEQRKK